MTREVNGRGIMKPSQARSEYVGALIPDECRLVLVSIDPEKPWDAIRALRRILRKEKKSREAMIGMFSSPTPIEHTAEVITLASRRRAG